MPTGNWIILVRLIRGDFTRPGRTPARLARKALTSTYPSISTPWCRLQYNHGLFTTGQVTYNHVVLMKCFDWLNHSSAARNLIHNHDVNSGGILYRHNHSYFSHSVLVRSTSKLNYSNPREIKLHYCCLQLPCWISKKNLHKVQIFSTNCTVSAFRFAWFCWRAVVYGFSTVV